MLEKIKNMEVTFFGIGYKYQNQNQLKLQS